MKILQLTIICLLLALGANAQKSVNKFIKKHKQNAHTFTMTIPGWLIRSGVNQADKYSTDQDDKAIFAIAKHVEKIRFIVFDEEYKDISSEIREVIKRSKEKDNLETYTSVRDNDMYIQVLVEERKDKIKNIVFISNSDDETAIVTVKTDLPLSEFQKANFSFTKKAN